MDSLSEWFFLIIGTILGLASSFLFWFVQSHYVVPRIEFSQFISKINSRTSEQGHLYRVKFANRAKRRAIDLSIRSRYSIKDFPELGIRTWIDLPLQTEYIPLIGRRGSSRTIEFRVELAKTEQFETFPESIKELLHKRLISIEDLLGFKPEASVTIYVFAFDEFSGARKLYISKDYKKEDIRTGKFSGLAIEPQS